MNDRLTQVLSDIDRLADAPAIDADALSSRVRRTVHRRKTRRRIAGGVSIAAIVIAVSASLAIHRVPPPPSIVVKRTESLENLQAQIDLHSQIASALAAHEKPNRKLRIADDSYLRDLAFERNRAALTLIHSARSQMTIDEVESIEQIRRAIALFPDTPAAIDANKWLEKNSRSQS